MGLDNGIYLKTRRPLIYEKIPLGLESRFHEAEENLDGFYYYEICYWRKWWPMRNAIIGYLANNDEGGGYYDLTPAAVHYLIDYEFECLRNPDDWDERGSIFPFDDMMETIAGDIAVLSWALKYLKSEGSGYLEFYDSY